ncbi:hypothetical protein C7E12_22765, partial [Stenotrophomonas maltophilia]
ELLRRRAGHALHALPACGRGQQLRHRTAGAPVHRTGAGGSFELLRRRAGHALHALPACGRGQQLRHRTAGAPV